MILFRWVFNKTPRGNNHHLKHHQQRTLLLPLVAHRYVIALFFFCFEFFVAHTYLSSIFFLLSSCLSNAETFSTLFFLSLFLVVDKLIDNDLFTFAYIFFRPFFSLTNNDVFISNILVGEKKISKLLVYLAFIVRCVSLMHMCFMKQTSNNQI
jgi:hypothetical protein